MPYKSERMVDRFLHVQESDRKRNPELSVPPRVTPDKLIKVENIKEEEMKNRVGGSRMTLTNTLKEVLFEKWWYELTSKKRQLFVRASMRRAFLAGLEVGTGCVLENGP